MNPGTLPATEPVCIQHHHCSKGTTQSSLNSQNRTFEQSQQQRTALLVTATPLLADTGLAPGCSASLQETRGLWQAQGWSVWCVTWWSRHGHGAEHTELLFFLELLPFQLRRSCEDSSCLS